MSYTIRTPHCPSCDTFEHSYGLIQGGLMMDAVHGGTADIPEFQFCPWCGAELQITEKVMPGELMSPAEALQRLLEEKKDKPVPEWVNGGTMVKNH